MGWGSVEDDNKRLLGLRSGLLRVGGEEMVSDLDIWSL